jgi:transglutaminase-like putative cysteine protease
MLAQPAGAADAPPWLREAAAAALPAYGKKVPAVVLLDEGRLTIDASGAVRRTTHWAVKVLTEEGRHAAAASVAYGTDAARVASLEAWLIPVSGPVKRYGKGEALDVALVGDDVYNEARSRVLSAGDGAEVGAVFGYEAVTEERPLFAQDLWSFQTRLPVRLSRYTAELPPGWRAVGHVFNHDADVAPKIAGTQYVWEVRDLPYIQEEPLSPPVTRLAPRLALAFLPEGGASPAAASFASWTDVSRWYTTLVGPPEAADLVAAKARELVREARDDLGRVRAIARFVQRLNYIAVQIGLGRYRPHPAEEVLAKSYGDCKDKANVMRVLLSAVGITSDLVLVYSGDPLFVREEWPSPSQFNHCILAVHLPAAADPGDETAVLVDPVLGRLLFFDPTHVHTRFGDLPADEQDSFALVAAGEQGRLLRLPRVGPERNRLDRTVDATLAANGALTAAVRETSLGQAAARERAFFQAPRPEVQRRLDRWLAADHASARVTSFHSQDELDSGRFQLDLEMSAPDYAQPLQGRLLMFRPLILSRRESGLGAGEPRTQPLELEDQSFAESLHVAVPEGYELDELPPSVSLDTVFGAYRFAGEMKDRQLSFTRRLELRRTSVPAAEIDSVLRFFEAIRAAESAQVVLVRAP